MFLKGKREVIILNGKKTAVIKPQENVSPEEAEKRIDKIIEKMRKEAGLN